MEIQKKFSIPAACLVFALLGAALGLTTRRDAKFASFVQGILLIYVYYVDPRQCPVRGQGRVGVAVAGDVDPGHRAGRARRRAPPAAGAPGRAVAGAGRPAPRARPAACAAAPPRGAAPTGPEAGRCAAPPRPGAGGRARGSCAPPSWTATSPGCTSGSSVWRSWRCWACSRCRTSSTSPTSCSKARRRPACWPSTCWYATPQFLYWCIPLSVLIAGLVTVGILTRTSELVVMRACGISLYRATAPLLVLAVLASGALFLVEEHVLAYTNRRAEALRHVIRGGSPRTFDILDRKWIVGRTGEIYNYLAFDPRRTELSAFSVFRFAPKAWRLQSRAFYKTVSFSGHATGFEQTVAWQGRDGWVREFDRQIEERCVPPGRSRGAPRRAAAVLHDRADRRGAHDLRRSSSATSSNCARAASTSRATRWSCTARCRSRG